MNNCKFNFCKIFAIVHKQADENMDQLNSPFSIVRVIKVSSTVNILNVLLYLIYLLQLHPGRPKNIYGK